MRAKSFIGEAEEAARRFYATVLRGEISDEQVRDYLRAASQIADVWREIDERLAARIREGTPPWTAYAELGYALAFIRAARAYQIFVEELLAADAAADPATAGFLSRVTFDQANALAHQMLPYLQRAVAAFTDPAYEPEIQLPFALRPRVDADGLCPASHLAGVMGAARELREWASGLIAEYTLAARAAAPVPTAIEAHITGLNSRLAQADAQLRFGTDLVGEITRESGPSKLHTRAENILWDALRGYFLLNQAVALPDLLNGDAGTLAPAKSGRPLALPERKEQSDHKGQEERHHLSARRIHPDDLWELAAPSARASLRNARFGQHAMKELCAKLDHTLSANAQRYLDEVAEAVRLHHAVMLGAVSTPPFEPLYRARRALNIAGAHIASGHEFHWNILRDRVESMPRYARANDWEANKEEE